MTDVLPQQPNCPQFLEDLAAKIAALLVDRGLDAMLAQGIARDCAEYVRSPEGWGGQQIYIRTADVAQRNRAIVAMFNGRNLRDVCRKHDLSATQVRRIIKAARKKGHGGEEPSR